MLQLQNDIKYEKKKCWCIAWAKSSLSNWLNVSKQMFLRIDAYLDHFHN